MSICKFCGMKLSEESRFCTRCGKPVSATDQSMSVKRHGRPPEGREAEDMNMTALYAMIVALILAVLFPPWETPPGSSPEFLGFHFILKPPAFGTNEGTGVISRLLITIELVTIAVTGFYVSWLFRRKSESA